ncbi:hypothetical protein [Empedobacter brevis]|uniref:DUF3887 domain-containing protein n=1 Tax=Empedobacter brevis NBRC 14943 = ATCC 43319 TaxID=1218108 RepID=A0A511NEX3_9FLAO|nr:hypothetical protein [Empedobacter brevis]GEM51335.1 hypothetical protein EB1_11250 [Empedobacter brevis NBRC 14943 = ATCC 43319]
MKKLILSVLILSFYTSCDSKTSSIQPIEKTIKAEVDYKVAVDFMNAYVKKTSDNEFVMMNDLLTENFKKRYETVMDSAYKVEPELGLGFDPIVDGQDFPNQFTIKKIDQSSGFVTLQGVDWQEFEVVLKVVTENNQSLVDGSGIINIPKIKQAKR